MSATELVSSLTLFVVLGAVLAGIAAYLLLVRKRQNRQSDKG